MTGADLSRISPRDPDVVMRLSRLGSFHQSRLSFMRQLLRRLKQDAWQFEITEFKIDSTGIGHAVYAAHGPGRSYALVAFSHDLPPEQRSDRVIATAWDATFTLFDGLPTAEDIARLRENVPRQEAGRISERELSLSRANRSVRMWDYVVDCLARGEQPDPARVGEVGYLMRTTAVYGSGKFGAADRESLADRPEFAAPFQVEMLSVYLTRAFVIDLVEHMARSQNPGSAVPLAPDLRRRFGIGNSTGLGMAPFLINHPALLHAWINAREVSLARVRNLPHASAAEAEKLRALVARAQIHAEAWRSEHPLQLERLGDLRADLARLAAHLQVMDLTAPRALDALWRWAETMLSLEGQEQLAALMIEPFGDLVDDLAPTMAVDEQDRWYLDGQMRLGALREIMENAYGWALKVDWDSCDAQARIWYVSEAKLEPRLGERFEEALDPFEQPLCPGRDAARLYAALQNEDPNAPLADLLLRAPEYRFIARRAQLTATAPYAEIRDNTLAATMMPIDMLRLKLSFFGACRFDPRSDRWVRINMFQNAPFPYELSDCASDDWTLPPLPKAAE